MPLEQDESGFYLGTTSIGYVISIILVIVPICVLVILEKLEVGAAVMIGFVSTILLCCALYPALLCWVILCYYLLQPQELQANKEETNKQVRTVQDGR
ncbi:MAG: hypothetical protein ACPGCS_02945 [Opitutales bacterium]